MKNLTWMSIAILLVAVTCENPIESDHENNNQSQVQPGILQLARIHGLDKSFVESSNYDTVTFALGEIRASKRFYFILKNVGGSPITDIAIGSSNLSFDISPDYIEILEPESLSTIIPILSIGALHGIALEGVGYIDIMPMGVNSSFVTITGTTSDAENDSIPINVVVSVSVVALIMDIRLFTGNEEIDLTDPYFVDSGIFEGITVSLPLYLMAKKDTFSIINTGNIPIIVMEYSGLTYNNSLSAEHMLNIGDTLISTISSVFEDTPSRYFAQHLIRLSGNGTVVNHKRLRLATDGNAHLWLVHDTDMLSQMN